METLELRKQRLLNIIDFNIQLINMNQHIELDYRKLAIDFNYSEKQLSEYQLIKTNAMDRDSWLSIPRVQHSPIPEIADKRLCKYIILSPDYKTSPKLNTTEFDAGLADIAYKLETDEANEKFNHRKNELLSLQQELQQKLEDYISTLWQPWATVEQEKAKTSEVYNKLYEIHTGTDNSDYELVFGVGMTYWKHHEQPICFPLITIPVDVILDHDTFTLDLVPQPNKENLELEQLQHVDSLKLQKLKKYFTEYIAVHEQISPFDIQSFVDIIKLAAGILDSSGVYSQTNSENQITDFANKLVIADSWVIFRRKKTKYVVLNDLEKLKQQIITSDKLDGAINSLVTEPSNTIKSTKLPNYRGLSTILSSTSDEINELFFPLPYNDEQIKIIQNLNVNDGVVVQGPPGTGKTHTIANIICHYLALGKRILVTSMSAHPLSVIQEKLPSEINDLVISLVSDDREGLKQFEKSIAGISQKVQEIIPHDYEAKITSLTLSIDKIHSNIAQLDSALNEIATKNSNTIIVGAKEYEPYNAVKLVFENPTQNFWPRDDIDIQDRYNPQFNEDDVIKFQQAQQHVQEDIKYLVHALPSANKLPEISSVIKTHNSLLKRNELLGLPVSEKYSPFIAEDESILHQASQVRSSLELIRDNFIQLMNNHQWVSDFMAALNDEHTNLLSHLRDRLSPQIETLELERQKFIIRPVGLPDNFRDYPDLIEAINKLTLGKKPFGIFGKKVERELLKEINVALKTPETTADWLHVKRFTNIVDEVKSLLTSWNSLASELKIKQIEVSSSNIATIKELSTINTVVSNITTAHEIKLINHELALLFIDKLQITVDQTLITQLDQLIANINFNLKVIELDSAEQHKNDYMSWLRSYEVTDITQAMLDLFSQVGTDNALTSDELFARLKMAYEQIEHLTHLKVYFDDISNFLTKLAASGAPLEAESFKQDWTHQIPEGYFREWELKRLYRYFNKLQSFAEIKNILHERAALVNRLAINYQEIVTSRSWLKIAENLTPRVRASLTSFAQSIRARGKGTGKKADYWKKVAQESAKDAVHGIPCWIMPHYKISENLPNVLCDFDLVIIDEASQSDFSALPALLRAKKILVVGDEKQVSPDNVGLQLDKIEQIRNSTLINQVTQYKAQITPERSIYDLFKVIFADSQIMLKEHFRCVPEIIDFSRKHFYNNQLVPLRIPTANNRLEYPLVDVLVRNGYRDNYDINKNEAEFIIGEIAKLILEEKYQNKTIGVISLLADKQAKFIMERLIAKIGIEQYERHKIVCGDARSFQGKEKDIIFLSLIVNKADGRSPMALGKESYFQRFNVALSRARDRMYLVRSLTTQDLSPADELRRNVLEHFNYIEANHVATPSENTINLCESEFEKDVYRFLVANGYSVTPQYKVGNFRIDLVIESSNGARLAIECDGDKYHGADRWEYDIRRQRILERAGWKFWRCFASQYYRNQELCHQDLIATLANYSIVPGKINPANTYLHIDYLANTDNIALDGEQKLNVSQTA